GGRQLGPRGFRPACAWRCARARRGARPGRLGRPTRGGAAWLTPSAWGPCDSERGGVTTLRGQRRVKLAEPGWLAGPGGAIEVRFVGGSRRRRRFRRRGLPREHREATATVIRP
ncbi:hypothetical protein U9M48_013595, partial [Paspalum notatum var. saurae]